MIIRSSNQLSRFALIKRFPLPRNFGVSSESRIEKGRTWRAPAGATRSKRFEIYNDYAGAEESNRRAPAWIEQNLKPLLAGPATAIAGPVIVHTIA